eukprot:2500667-Rhodomonas_salina.1
MVGCGTIVRNTRLRHPSVPSAGLVSLTLLQSTCVGMLPDPGNLCTSAVTSILLRSNSPENIVQGGGRWRRRRRKISNAKGTPDLYDYFPNGHCTRPDYSAKSNSKAKIWYKLRANDPLSI